MEDERPSYRKRPNSFITQYRIEQLSAIRQTVQELENPALADIAVAIGRELRYQADFLDIRVSDLIALFGLDEWPPETREIVDRLLIGQGIDVSPLLVDLGDDDLIGLHSVPNMTARIENLRAEAQVSHETLSPIQIAARIRQSLDDSRYYTCQVKVTELGKLFGFQDWSQANRDLVAKLLAVNGLYQKPEISNVGVEEWVILTLPHAHIEGTHPARSMVGYIVLASTMGPLVTAFCTELGKRLGGSTADWAARVKARKRKDEHPAVTAEIVIEGSEVTTILEITETLTDEAKLALIELDVEDVAVRGRRLAWDGNTHKWISIDE